MDLNIRDFPEELVRRAKSEAYLRGKTLRELVVEAVGRSLGDEGQSGRIAKKVVMGKPSSDGDGKQDREVEAEDSGQRSKVGKLRNKGGVAGGSNKASGKVPQGKQLTAEQFFALPRSEQDRARREGKY